MGVAFILEADGVRPGNNVGKSPEKHHPGRGNNEGGDLCVGYPYTLEGADGKTHDSRKAAAENSPKTAMPALSKFLMRKA
jgi:hypothetical protein